VSMFRFHERCRTLSDLVELRASLRRQDLALSGALRDVQTELRSWEQHRAARAAAGQPVPRELALVWDELAERERELAMDQLQVRAALGEANREIRNRLSPRPVAS
jgi:hypothetical protein